MLVGEIPCVALGEDINDVAVEVHQHQPPQTIEERVQALEDQYAHMMSMNDNLFSMLKEVRAYVQAEHDKRATQAIQKTKLALPEGIVLSGTTRGLSFFLQVKDGGFWVGNTQYPTLSAAAEAVSGVRRSGLTFWKLPDGKTVKEVFKG